MAVDAMRELVDALKQDTQEKQRTSLATVSHIGDDGLAWVLLPGAEAETPTATADAEAAPGDTVTVEWRGNQLHVLGNSTAPATSTCAVRRIVEPVAELAEEAAAGVGEARDSALAAETAAAEAKAAAEATSQHFWHREDNPEGGVGAGAFVTTVPQADFIAYTEGGEEPPAGNPLHNLLMNAEGILLRAAKRIRAAFTPSGVAFYDGQGNEAENIVAQFGKDGTRVGKVDSGNVTISDNGVLFADSEGGMAASITSTAASGVVYQDVRMVDGAMKAGEPQVFFLAPVNDFDIMQAVELNYIVWETVPEGDDIDWVTPDYSGTLVFYGAETFENEPATCKMEIDGDAMRFSLSVSLDADWVRVEAHYAYSRRSPQLTLGTRTGGHGAYSLAVGTENEVAGKRATALGYSLTAPNADQFVIGYGNARTDGALVIGAGYGVESTIVVDRDGREVVVDHEKMDEYEPHNALVVDWNGNVRLANPSGNTISNTGNLALSAGSAQWTFGTNGTMTAPSGAPVPVFRTGNIAGAAIASGAYRDVAITYNGFTAAPAVVACLSTTSTSGNAGRIAPSVLNITATGATIRILNGDASSRSPVVRWLAVGV